MKHIIGNMAVLAASMFILAGCNLDIQPINGSTFQTTVTPAISDSQPSTTVGSGTSSPGIRGYNGYVLGSRAPDDFEVQRKNLKTPYTNTGISKTNKNLIWKIRVVERKGDFKRTNDLIEERYSIQPLKDVEGFSKPNRLYRDPHSRNEIMVVKGDEGIVLIAYYNRDLMREHFGTDTVTESKLFSTRMDDFE